MASASNHCVGIDTSVPPLGDDELFTLSGDKPFFDIMFAKSHVTEPYTMNLSKMVTNALPRETKTVRLCHGNKIWDMEYVKSGRFHRFCARDWKIFVADNELKKDDSIICEVVDVVGTTSIVKVHIMRDVAAVPPKLVAYFEAQQDEVNEIINID